MHRPKRQFAAAERERKYANIIADADEAAPKSIVLAVYGSRAETAYERDQREARRA